MLSKYVLSVAAGLALGSHAFAQEDKVLTLIQKSALTQLCLEGKFDGKNGVNQLVNSVIGSKLQGDSGMSAPQGSLVISDGRGKYALVEMASGSFWSREAKRKGDDKTKSRTGQVNQTVYAVMMVEQGVVTNTELSVTDYLTGKNDGRMVQYCRVGMVGNKDLKDQKANAITNIMNYRELFSSSKTVDAAKAAIDSAAKSGRNKLTAKELSILKELLFGDMGSQDKTETAQIADSLYAYSLDVRANEKDQAEGETQNREVSIRDEEVKKMNYNLAAMQAVVVKAGFEVIGKKAMFIGENDLIGEGQQDGKYHASGARTHSLLRLVRDPRTLDILIVK